MKQFLDKKEVAAYLGLSEYTIDSWVSQGIEIPFVKMGRRVKFDMHDILQWIEANKHHPTGIKH